MSDTSDLLATYSQWKVYMRQKTSAGSRAPTVRVTVSSRWKQDRMLMFGSFRCDECKIFFAPGR